MSLITVPLLFISSLTIYGILHPETFIHSWSGELCPPIIQLDGFRDCQNMIHHIMRGVISVIVIIGVLGFWINELYKVKQTMKKGLQNFSRVSRN